MIESGILIICDEPAASSIWALCITELHCRPLAANPIKQAVNIIEESSPDLMSVDVTSRDVSGIQMCHDLREHANAPLLLLTPINNESHTLEACQAISREAFS
jgi:DNA-binding response OmpR family regulator